MKALGSNRDGYSLMEAMVALFVLAIASTALLLATRAHIDGVGGLEDRVTAQWVAENRLAELMLGDQAAQSGNVTMMGRDWVVSVQRSPTDDPDLLAVEIIVSRNGQQDVHARLNGFIDRGATV